jgi:hypothetical protein
MKKSKKVYMHLVEGLDEIDAILLPLCHKCEDTECLENKKVCDYYLIVRKENKPLGVYVHTT